MRVISQNIILVAEDSADDTFFIRYAFSQADVQCQLRFVTHGQEMIDYLEGKPPYDDRHTFPLPKLLILDIKMPLVNGFEVLEWLGSNLDFQHLPAIIHSSSALEEDKERAAKLGAKGYYVKSEQPSNLLDMFRELCQKWLNETAAPTSQGLASSEATRPQ